MTANRWRLEVETDTSPARTSHTQNSYTRIVFFFLFFFLLFFFIFYENRITAFKKVTQLDQMISPEFLILKFHARPELGKSNCFISLSGLIQQNDQVHASHRKNAVTQMSRSQALQPYKMEETMFQLVTDKELGTLYL